MKKTFIYSGYLETSFDELVKILNLFLDSSKIRDRYAADIEREVKYNDDELDLYSYKYSEKGKLIQVELKGSNEDALNFIEVFTENLRINTITHQFEWGEVDENEAQIGEEYVIRYPEDSI